MKSVGQTNWRLIKEINQQSGKVNKWRLIQEPNCRHNWKKRDFKEKSFKWETIKLILKIKQKLISTTFESRPIEERTYNGKLNYPRINRVKSIFFKLSANPQT